MLNVKHVACFENHRPTSRKGSCDVADAYPVHTHVRERGLYREYVIEIKCCTCRGAEATPLMNVHGLALFIEDDRGTLVSAEA